MRTALVTLLLAVSATQCLAQEDYEVRCQVYRFNAEARAKLLADSAVTAARAKELGRLRFEAVVPLRGGRGARVTRVSKFPFETQTTNNVATSRSVSFMHVSDTLAATLRRTEDAIELEFNLSLDDVTTERGAAGLPIVRQYALTTQLSLQPGKEWVIVQGGEQTSAEETFQVVVVRVIPAR